MSIAGCGVCLAFPCLDVPACVLPRQHEPIIAWVLLENISSTTCLIQNGNRPCPLSLHSLSSNALVLYLMVRFVQHRFVCWRLPSLSFPLSSLVLLSIPSMPFTTASHVSVSFEVSSLEDNYRAPWTAFPPISQESLTTHSLILNESGHSRDGGIHFKSLDLFRTHEALQQATSNEHNRAPAFTRNATLLTLLWQSARQRYAFSKISVLETREVFWRVIKEANVSISELLCIFAVLKTMWERQCVFYG